MLGGVCVPGLEYSKVNTVCNIDEDIVPATGPLQTCAGHATGSEAAVHVMKEMCECEAALLVDASNAFNCINRLAALHNISSSIFYYHPTQHLWCTCPSVCCG